MNTVLLVAIGFILGSFLASAGWIVLFMMIKAERQLLHEKGLIMQAIADEAADADKVLSSTVLKAMNTHALRSALLPKVDKIKRQLTTNMHVLDIYFVKYMELRISEYKKIYESGDSTPSLTVDKFLNEAKPVQAEVAPESHSQDLRVRMRVGSFDPQLKAENVPTNMISKDETFIRLPKVPTEQKTVPPTIDPEITAAPEKLPEPPEPTLIDHRTGIITVSDEAREQKPTREYVIEKAPSVAAVSKPQVEEKKFTPSPENIAKSAVALDTTFDLKSPVALGKYKPPRMEEKKEEEFDLEAAVEPCPDSIPKPAVVEEDAFDFEAAVGAGQKKPDKTPRPPDTRPLQGFSTDKTLVWDRQQLSGASAPAEEIFVEGAEISGIPKVAEVPTGSASVSTSSEELVAADNDDGPMISGEDIEHTLDSFFGLDKK
jgi:hypothetical protein